MTIRSGVVIASSLFLLIISLQYASLEYNPLTKIIDTVNSKGYYEPPNEEWIDGRRFLWQTPSTGVPKTGYPVILLLHGASQHAEAWFGEGFIWGKQQTTFTLMALEMGYIVIAPDSLRPIPLGPRAWDAFAPTVNDSIDLPFIQSILRWIGNTSFQADMNRVYCVGFSSGAFMTSRIAQTLGSYFAAMAVHSGSNADAIRLTLRGPVFNCTPSHFILPTHPPTILIHGEKDNFVPLSCSQSYYEELQWAHIHSVLYIQDEGRHIWFPEYNEAIFTWFETYSLVVTNTDV